MKTFQEFWPEYLNQHRHPTNRLLHAFGTLFYLFILSLAWVNGQYRWLFLAPLFSLRTSLVWSLCYRKKYPGYLFAPMAFPSCRPQNELFTSDGSTRG